MLTDSTHIIGAVFGMYEVVGQKLDGRVGGKRLGLIQKLAAQLPDGIVPRSFSRKEDVPKWWTDKRVGNEA